jgi:hypothetical protein
MCERVDRERTVPKLITAETLAHRWRDEGSRDSLRVMAPDPKSPEEPRPARPRRQDLRREMLGSAPELIRDREGVAPVTPVKPATPYAPGVPVSFDVSYGEPIVRDHEGHAVTGLRGSLGISVPAPEPGVAFDICQDHYRGQSSLRVVETGTIYNLHDSSPADADHPFPARWQSVVVPAGLSTITFETTRGSDVYGFDFMTVNMSELVMKSGGESPTQDPVTVTFAATMSGHVLYSKLSVPAADVYNGLGV